MLFEKCVKGTMKVNEKESNCTKMVQESSSMVKRLTEIGLIDGVVTNDDKIKIISLIFLTSRRLHLGTQE